MRIDLPDQLSDREHELLDRLTAMAFRGGQHEAGLPKTPQQARTRLRRLLLNYFNRIQKAGHPMPNGLIDTIDGRLAITDDSLEVLSTRLAAEIIMAQLSRAGAVAMPPATYTDFLHDRSQHTRTSLEEALSAFEKTISPGGGDETKH